MKNYSLSVFVCEESQQKTHCVSGALMTPLLSRHPCVCLVATEIYCPITDHHLFWGGFISTRWKGKQSLYRSHISIALSSTNYHIFSSWWWWWWGGVFSFAVICLHTPSIPPKTPTTPRLEFPIDKKMRRRREKKARLTLCHTSWLLRGRIRVCECVRVHSTTCVTWIHWELQINIGWMDIGKLWLKTVCQCVQAVVPHRVEPARRREVTQCF